MPRLLSEAEFNGLKSQVLKAAPDGLKADDFQRYVGPAMDAAVGEAENSRAPLEGSALERFASGAWKNLNPMNLVTAALHPADTVKGLIDAHAAQLDKAKAAYADGHYSEAAGHLAAAALPVVGPAAANAGERIASGDIAGGAGEGAALLAPVAAAEARVPIGKATSAAGRALEAAGKSSAMERVGSYGAAGAMMHGDVIKAGVAALAPTALEQGGKLLQFVGGKFSKQAAAAGLSDLDFARQEAAAGRLPPAILKAIERKAAMQTPAAAQGAPAASPPVAPPAEPIATPAPASPAVASPQPEAPPALDTAGNPAITAQPPVTAAPVTPPKLNQIAINAIGIAGRRAKLRLSLDEVKALVPLVEQGATPEQAIGSYVAAQAAADPAAALAARLGTPADAEVATRIAERNSNGQWQPPKADMAARQQVLTEQRMAELRKKFGGRHP